MKFTNSMIHRLKAVFREVLIYIVCATIWALVTICLLIPTSLIDWLYEKGASQTD